MAEKAQRAVMEDAQIPQVTVAPVPPAELVAFKRRLGAAFDAAMREEVPGFAGGDECLFRFEKVMPAR
jgi:hypothetical protein